MCPHLSISLLLLSCDHFPHKNCIYSSKPCLIKMQETTGYNADRNNREVYRKNIAILGNEVDNIVWKWELSRSWRERHQVVVVHKVIASKSDENKCIIHKLSCFIRSNKRAHPGLVLLEVLQLFVDSDYIELQNVSFFSWYRNKHTRE